MRSQVDPVSLVDGWIEAGIVKGASLLVIQHGDVVLKHHAGLACFGARAGRVTDETVFLIASITKTITATCFVQYVEEGKFWLDDRVVGFISEFGRQGKEGTTFRHLLTHTSGLAEQVEGKDELRRREAAMEEFLDQIYRSRPCFPPGKGFQYSNCGFAVLARAVELMDGRRFGEILHERVLAPLGMVNSALGFDESWDARLAEIEISAGKEREREFLNSRYWRGLGAPWGALASNVDDLGRFAEAMRRGGELHGVRILSGAAVDAMTRDQLYHMPEFPASAQTGPHGLAWRLRSEVCGEFFGDLTTPGSYGHTGATGTFLWVDPALEISAVFLANKEGGNDERRFARLSNAIVASCA